MSQYELEVALKEDARNKACDAYFKARPEIDDNYSRRLFEAGFERAWEARNIQDKKS